jgi:RecJ-like exonuclease
MNCIICKNKGLINDNTELCPVCSRTGYPIAPVDVAVEPVTTPTEVVETEKVVTEVAPEDTESPTESPAEVIPDGMIVVNGELVTPDVEVVTE